MTAVNYTPRKLAHEGQRTLPQAYFTDPAILAQEQERLLLNGWVAVGRAEQVASPGQYFLADVAGQSIIVLRDRGGVIRAFYNVCAHRGSQLCEEHQGQFSETLQCPYHAWTYALDGRLVGAPSTSDLAGFSKADWPLRPVAVGCWEGFLFLNLSPRPEPFERYMAPVWSRFARFGSEHLRLGRTIEYTVHANWKLIVQNYSECYHCALVHPELTRLTPPTAGENDLTEGPFLGGYMDLNNPAGSMTMSGRVCGLPVSADIPKEDHGRVYYYSLMPNMLLSLHPDYVMYHILWPRSVNQTSIFCSWLFHPDTLANPAFDINDGISFWDMTNRQDWHVCELSQRGIESRGYQPGPYSHRESIPASFDRYYLKALGHGGAD
ncbi:MAG TPA: aromatic ring-hydroxylating dioxygenase subunit alpha [Gemmatimonadales bacterium]|nr:aromatic ring-hydroxylating dioxygenase subunit alpha [Gemmatimonadales bacterium]